MAEITTLALVAGTTTHVTVVDHNNADAPLPPSSITWAVTGGFADTSMIIADATGFNFAPTSPGSGSFRATYHSGTVSSPGPTLSVTVTAAVSPAYISP